MTCRKCGTLHHGVAGLRCTVMVHDVDELGRPVRRECGHHVYPRLHQGHRATLHAIRGEHRGRPDWVLSARPADEPRAHDHLRRLLLVLPSGWDPEDEDAAELAHAVGAEEIRGGLMADGGDPGLHVALGHPTEPVLVWEERAHRRLYRPDAQRTLPLAAEAGVRVHPVKDPDDPKVDLHTVTKPSIVALAGRADAELLLLTTGTLDRVRIGPLRGTPIDETTDSLRAAGLRAWRCPFEPQGGEYQFRVHACGDATVHEVVLVVGQYVWEELHHRFHRVGRVGRPHQRVDVRW